MFSFFKTFIAFFIALFTHRKYKDYWIIGERGTDARDNAYWMFRYIREKHPEKKIVYLIDPKSPDYSKIKELGDIIIPDSIHHGVVFLSCDTMICTHTYLCRPSWRGMHFILEHKFFNKNERRIFLDHGIVKDYLPAFTYPSLNVDLFTSGAKPEFDYIVANFNFPSGVVHYTGLARYDNLFRNIKNNKTNKMILYMPTWRFYLSDCKVASEFEASDFYMKMDAFLKDDNVIRILEEFDYKLVFYPHYEVQKWIQSFNGYSNRIEVASFEKYDVQKLLMDCDLLITDYSSVFFDVAYMNKPVIFYQFDQQLFRKTQYQEGYFDYSDSFGPLVDNQDNLIDEMVRFLKGDFCESFYQKERDFFPLKDDKCCERIYSLILNCKR